MEATRPSLYSDALELVDPDEKPTPFPPGTVYTASVETIDNDYSPLLQAADAFS